MRLASITIKAMPCRKLSEHEITDSKNAAYLLASYEVLVMSRAEVEVALVEDTYSAPARVVGDAFQHLAGSSNDRLMSLTANRQGRVGPRRTPRKSLIVVLAENHVVSPDLVARRLLGQGDDHEMDVILACAGQSTSIIALQRQVPDLQVLEAPAGTSIEDLRELAMRQAPGDIVTLLCGTPV